MIKYLCLIFLLTSCANFTQKSNDLSKKIAKKPGHCSPLDKLQGKTGCLDEKVEEKKSAINTKIRKREGYCSPLDKAQKKAGCL